MDFSDIFRIVNFAVAVFMVLGGISKFFGFSNFSDIILGAYLIVFGAGTALLGSLFLFLVGRNVYVEWQPPRDTSGVGRHLPIIPPQVARYASFMFSFLGRGIFYIFIGSVIVGPKWFRFLPGSIVGIIGIGYVVLEYIPSIEPPANMRDADAGWGAEQV